MRIAMIGQRGVPASFGGVEHHVEELGSRLAARGHDVTVFCRPNYATDRRPEYRGMRLRYLPTVGTKHLDAIVHSALSSAATLDGHFDVVHFHALGPGLAAPLPRALSRAKVVQTIHGLDNERAKWSVLGRGVLTTAAWMSAHVPHATITVSRALARHFARRYGRDATYVPNGVAPGRHRPAQEITARFRLTPGSYALFVGRFVPEKAPDLLVEAFRGLPGDVRLVLAGGSSFTTDYVAQVQRLAGTDHRIVLPGYVYGTLLQELYANAGAFVLPSSLEGLPLTLLEAASYGTPVVASAIEPHVEVLNYDAPGHRLVPVGDAAALRRALQATFHDPDHARDGARRLRSRVLNHYSWDAAAVETERLYLRLVSRSRTPRPAAADPEPGSVAV